MDSKKTKDYLDQDFFLNEDGKSVFEAQSDEKIKQKCVTDSVDEIMVLNEKRKSASDREMVELVIGLGHNIPLWKRNLTLNWRFNPLFDKYSNSSEVKDYIRGIFNKAVNMWGDASPVGFQETTGQWDFEITMQPDDCNPYGCTLASAFFPNTNQNVVILHPKMFSQSNKEQIETLIHEIGHIFGLRHYFAKEREASWRSEVFGVHYPLTIMNYGHQSTLTEQDRIDLKALYSKVWNGQLTNINGLPIKLYNCYTQS